jgi:hypothetical protein
MTKKRRGCSLTRLQLQPKNVATFKASIVSCSLVILYVFIAFLFSDNAPFYEQRPKSTPFFHPSYLSSVPP